MKSKKFKFDLTLDLIEIFKKSYSVSKDLGIRYITLEVFFRELLLYYFDRGDKFYDPVVKNAIGYVNKDNRGEILDELEKMIEEKKALWDKGRAIDPTEHPEIADFLDPQVISLDQDFEEIVDRALELNEKFFPIKKQFGNGNEVLSTDVLMLAILETDEFGKLLFKFGFSYKRVHEQISSVSKLMGSSDIVKKINKQLEEIGKEKDETKREEKLEEVAGMLLKTVGEKEEDNEGGDNNGVFNQMNDDEAAFEKYGNDSGVNAENIDPNSDTPYIDLYSEDMTKKARDKGYDTIIGRDDIVDSMIEILGKRRKPNIALISGPGIGKTAVVERLAQRIVEGKVPARLANKRICALNLNDLIAGTKYRGEYEERLQKIIKEVCNNKDIIIMLDELHTLVSGSAGQSDTGNILKPYLARGQFQCIGATTNEEYRKYIEKDKALSRRFTQVIINEPTRGETIKILNGISSFYEKFHRVRYSKETIELCVEWGGRYIADKNFPDKAIDIMDMVGSLVSLRRIETNEDTNEIEMKLKDVIQKKIQAVTVDYDFELGDKLRQEEIKLNQEIEAIEKKNEKTRDSRKNWPEVTVDDVALAVSRISKIPIDKINQSDRARLKVMRDNLMKTVIGQPEAINEVMDSITRSALGLRVEGKPIGIFLFSGSTATGKTYLAKRISEEYFGSQKAMVKFDMSSMTSEADVSRLIGSSPGYIRSDESGEFIKVKETNGGSCVLVFDEIEKANSKIYDVLLPVLDEAKLELASGELVDFSNTIIIFTSNVGTKEIKNHVNIGFGDVNDEAEEAKNKEIVKKAIENKFKPEFLNRITKQITFRNLTREDLGKIFNLELDKIKKQLNKNKVKIKVGNSIKNKILDLCTEKMGARELSRHIDKMIISEVGHAMVDEPDKSQFQVEYKEDKVVVEAL